MVARGLASPAAHAARVLDLLYEHERIDPRQEPDIILATVKWYRELRDHGFATNDVVATLPPANAAPLPDWDDAEEYDYTSRDDVWKDIERGLDDKHWGEPEGYV